MTENQNQADIDVEEQINLLELLQIIAKRKMFIIKMCTFAVVASVAYSFTLPNIYSATAKVLPPQKETAGGLSAMLGQVGGIAGLAPGGLGSGTELYLGLLRSRSVADEVVRRLDLTAYYKTKDAELARRGLEATVRMQTGKDGIINITADDKDPKMAARVANMYVEELGRTSVRLNLSKAGSERAFLEKRLELVKGELKKAEDEIKAFSQQNSIVQVDSQAKASIEGIARLKAELATKEVQLAALRSRQTDESPEVRSLLAGIKRLQAEMDRMSGPGLGGEGIPAIGNVPRLGLEYARKMRELKIQESVFEQLTKQYEMAKLSEAKDSSAFQVLDTAVAPSVKSKPRRSAIVITATMVAVAASLVLIFLQEHLEKMSEADRKILADIKGRLLSLR
ncbi:MAG: hypothetical protein ACD_55C00139G0002 [uncultured bacterium]|uniref:Polysaccharide chain length determinant protein n=1 Tax=Citrifermentans bemidjiense (strain ATCC BAA-1014 / DSM 16622 / JCM 12645 / Bem) TaxID=404380 RepID=B5E8N8_CITBB|nr:Wzz/FepE/Etk N-terminal domain-containing protein [Citrifermentans bemidjiense]ACH38623.1 polysaccharide chain length determinant protein [Citrifermentans bemidjiense Bem]EKD59149.1 MAG: hypothetical protein ACD_55C00139G0002 [uncultured bacterium]